jgi:hypothetical protein
LGSIFRQKQSAVFRLAALLHALSEAQEKTKEKPTERVGFFSFTD